MSKVYSTPFKYVVYNLWNKRTLPPHANFLIFFFGTFVAHRVKNDGAIRICHSHLVSKLWPSNVFSFTFIRMHVTLL